MATLIDLLAGREAAGARYAAALTALSDAYVELAAIDLALMNGHVRLPAPQQPVRTFHPFLQAFPQELTHPVYASPDAGSLIHRRDAATATLLASFTGGAHV